jgi:hypothetical protein
MVSRHRTILLCCFALLPAWAAGCHTIPSWMRRQDAALPPQAFTGPPTLEDVVYVVNANTDRVQQLYTDDAVLRVEGIPALRANVAYRQPRDFRLRAELSRFTGQELDMGSNSELFWFWVRRDEQPNVYFARHDEFAYSPARDLVPLEPNRLIEALGLVRLASHERHTGPTPRDGNLLEIRSQIPSPRGDITRVLVLDATYGWMVEQHYYDPNGQLLMSARADQHRYYPEDAVTMPHHIQVRLLPGHPSPLAFDVDIGRYVFNRPTGEPGEMFAMPRIEGYPAVDIAAPDFRPPTAVAVRDHGQAQPSLPGAAPSTMSSGATMPPQPPGVYGLTLPGGTPQSTYGAPRTANLPTYRGYR